MAKKYTVRRQPGSRQYGVYLGNELIEGGFFSRAAAEACAERYQQEVK